MEAFRHEEGAEGFTRFLGVTKEDHVCIPVEKDCILLTSVSCVSNRPLQDEHALALPDPKDRHSVLNTAVGIILGTAVTSV